MNRLPENLSPVVCKNCAMMLVRIAYQRCWWFPLVREPLLLGMRILAWRHGIDARAHGVRNPECRGCIRFMKAELEEKSPTFRFLNNRIGNTISALRDARATHAERDEAKRYAREAMGLENKQQQRQGAIMSIQTAISERRSIRAYQDRPVEDEKLQLVLEAARLSPSARNRQEWKFVVVKDRETRERLARAANGKQFVAEAPVIIAACATEAEYVMSCGQLAGTVDTSIAFSYLILQAHELGLGTCWLGAYNESEVKDILGIPPHVRVVAMTPLGYPAESPEAKPRKGLEEIVALERYR
jgi:nitroreductase